MPGVQAETDEQQLMLYLRQVAHRAACQQSRLSMTRIWAMPSKQGI